MKVLSNMTSLLKKNTTAASLFILSLLFVSQAFADGRPVSKGKYLASITTSYFLANKTWDKDGVLSTYPLGGYFSSVGLSLSLQYGISRRLTAVTNIPYSWNVNYQNYIGNQINGFGDGEIGVRYYLGNINFKYYFSVQGLLIVPLYKGKNLGFEAPGGDLKLSGTGSGSLGGSNSYFFSVEAGVRQYMSVTGPFQLRYNVPFGVNIHRKHLFTAGITGVISTSNNKDFSANLVQNKDFSFVQGSLSYGYIFNPRFIVFAGANESFIGKNTGKGLNFYLSVSTKF